MNIKKKLTALAAAAAVASSLSPAALAETSTDEFTQKVNDIINTVSADEDVDILLNGELMTFDDVKPEIISDRTMLPFRKVLEDLGATVSFDNDTRTASATKDDITISFSIDSNVITVNNGGEVSTIEMDVAPVIKNDRTLVPIRFMSESFGMSVGWDNTYRTAVIVDYASYAKEIEATAPNYTRLISLTGEMMETLPENYTSTSSVDLTIAMPDGEGQSEISFSIDETGKVAGANSEGDSTMDITVNAVDGGELSTLLADLPIDLNDIKGARFVVRTVDGKYYLKTNLLQVLEKAMPDNDTIGLASMVIDESVWIEFTMEQLMSVLAPGTDMSALNDMMAAAELGKAPTVEDSLRLSYEGLENIDLMTGLSIDLSVASFADIDSGITIEQQDNSLTIGMNVEEAGVTVQMTASVTYAPAEAGSITIDKPLSSLTMQFSQLLQALEMIQN